ncbi:unnamed protein product [Heligmosomoides polygyrus]|uniref:Protein CNPPD1 n=1 Tax=Heligmosomoides polygyrus TaxID=6339 RepID=A0A3P7WM76_HELPZ|nr:unnamed protein product [Heligmosomoides polygyrus]
MSDVVNVHFKVSFDSEELVVDFFNKRSPFDYMKPETSATISGRGYADPCTLVVAMVYLDRIRVKNKNWFESSDPTDLYLPSLVLASKFLHDSDTYDRASNAEWAEAANISSEHLNQLEWEFVQRLNWNVMVDQAEFDSWLRFFEYWVANDFLAKNGFCTYNELVQLSTTFPLASMLQALASFFGLMVFVYTFSVVSLFAIPCSRSFTDVSVVENSSMHPVSSVLVAVPDELRMLSTEVKPARSWTDLLQVGSTRKEASAFEDSNSSASEFLEESIR